MKWRFVDLGLVAPAFGPAAFEAVMDSIRCDLADDTILFWRPDSPAVYVGFHQFVEEDIDVEKCRQRGVPIVRRILGGGSGYCDANQILYNVIFREGSLQTARGPRGVYLLVLGGVVEALRTMGLKDACIEETRFGVLAGGRKISGSGQLSSGGVINSGGSFLADFDYDAMKEVLKDPVKNLSSGVREPEDGMTCLRKELGDATIEEASSHLRKGFEAVLGSAYDARLTDYEYKLSSSLMDKYTSFEWTFRADERKKKRERNKRHAQF